MLKITSTSLVLLALAFPQVGFAADDLAPSKTLRIGKRCRINFGGLKDLI